MLSRFSLVAFVLILAGCGGSAPVATPEAAPPTVAAPTESAQMPGAMPMQTPEAPSSVLDGVEGLTFDPDTVQAGRFDNGRMFTLDDPPRDYLAETYDFRPDDEWFERAQLGALRFATYCSASFVSASGLVLTNHHCARESVTKASLEDGQDYNEAGYYAGTMAQEKPIEDLFVEQLIEIIDVTAEVDAAASGEASDAEKQQARAAAVEAITTRMTEERGEDVRAQVITLYAGGQYKAYIFKRYGDVRLVFAPETALGYFGGDPDNFTYPRYSLDFSLFRAYGEDGQPVRPDVFFPFQEEGSDPGDLVFVIGNPGSTTRLNTVAELAYRRDVTEPALLDFLTSREAAYKRYLDATPDDPLYAELEDTYFSLGNGRKAYTGRVQGLRDPYILARREAAERAYQRDLRANAQAQGLYGDIVDRISDNRTRARDLAPQARAFTAFGPGSPYNGAVLNRGLAYVLSEGSPEALLAIEDQPELLQTYLLEARFQDFEDYLGADDEVTQALLKGRTAAAAAQAMVDGSALTTAESTQEAIDSGADLSQDPAVLAANAVLPALRAYFGAIQPLNAEQSELQSKLARSRFEIYGTSTPPDATFSLRITDGVVKGYPYNGTVTPPYTTFYGLYDRYVSQCLGGDTSATADETCDWYLPSRWREMQGSLPLSTPYNFVSTNDIIGGNSGSPVLNRDLEVVGIAFDGNIEGLPGNYIFDDTLNRTVSLDVRAMLMVLDDVYKLDRLVDELTD
ncbi:S46 family peptidase [Rubricoccus marinus]|uniref:Dipeptidyl-peptidase n=1 Tax=Rubricoccus marinus TaxID=716817 RepID=A0A259TXA2_9BACT|nr:S46 family peptidase [Rubricoccus marinus]OZC02257.1 hypothetical protein BSZ36_04185 [Rubricoccus marinus]